MEDKARPTAKFVHLTVIVAGLLLLAVILLTPVKGWLNRIPFLWQVLFPVLTLFAGTIVVTAVRARESWFSIAKWAVLMASTAGASIYFLLDAPRIFFTLGRVCAIVFVVAEVVDTLAASLARDNATDAG